MCCIKRQLFKKFHTIICYLVLVNQLPVFCQHGNLFILCDSLSAIDEVFLKKLFLFLKKYISNFCIFQLRELNFTTISAARLEILHSKNNLKFLICYRLANYFCLAV